MAPESSLMSLWVCVTLCLSHSRSVPIACRFNGHQVESSLELLKTTGGSFPVGCLEEKVAIPFPASAFRSAGVSEVSDVFAMVLNETFSSVTAVFADGDAPPQWRPSLLEDFHNRVFRLSDDFSPCATTVRGLRGDVKSGFLDRAQLVKTYFDKMEAVLREKKYSFCAWEIVRQETVRTLEFILEHNADSLLWP
ncbi:interferon alpha-6-like [Arapaima gigas]